MLVVLILLVGGYLLYGQAKGGPDGPRAIHEDCERLEAQIEKRDEQIRDLEYEIKRAQKAVANYEYVRERNAATIERLQQWVESK